MNINEFDYQLPKELIAQRPLKDRDQCRLMILDRQEKSIEQKKFYDVLEYLKPGDCIVTVSYTHLDVYKRQIYRGIVKKAGAGSPCRFLCAFSDNHNYQLQLMVMIVYAMFSLRLIHSNLCFYVKRVGRAPLEWTVFV